MDLEQHLNDLTFKQNFPSQYKYAQSSYFQQSYIEKTDEYTNIQLAEKSIEETQKFAINTEIQQTWGQSNEFKNAKLSIGDDDTRSQESSEEVEILQDPEDNEVGGFQVITKEYIEKIIQEEQQKLRNQIKIEPINDLMIDNAYLENPYLDVEIQNRIFYQKFLRFLQYSFNQLDQALQQAQPLFERIQKFSDKSIKIVEQKVQQKSTNFSAIKLFFNTLKQEYDKWFYLLVDVFQGIQEIIQQIEKFQWQIKDKLEELTTQDAKCKWAMYSSAFVTLLGMPVSGYSVALAIGTGSIKYKRYKISMTTHNLTQFQELNMKILRLLKEKEEFMRKMIDQQVQIVKMGIEQMAESANRKKFGTASDTLKILKQLRNSFEQLKSSQYMSITVFDAMSLKNLDDSYM
eukprot:403338480